MILNPYNTHSRTVKTYRVLRFCSAKGCCMDFCFCTEDGEVKFDGAISREEADALKYLYCGEKSKATLVATYFYQLYLSGEHDKCIKDELKCFLLSEIQSMTAVKNAIEFFGGNVALYSRQGFWRAKWMNFGTDVKMFLKDDLVLEKECIVMMISICKKTQNKSLKEFLRKLIADEELNMRLLENLISRV